MAADVRRGVKRKEYLNEPCTHAAFVVRVVSPSEVAVNRLITWGRSLQKLGIDCWVSVDTTCTLGTHTERNRILQLVRDGWQLHRYDESEMLSTFPGLFNLSLMPRVACAMVDVTGRKRRSLAWGFHVEALCLWWAAADREYAYTWVFEDDVGFTGDIAELLTAFETDHSDLLAYREQFVDNKWYWLPVASNNFAVRFCSTGLRKINEHVVRVSCRLFKAIIGRVPYNPNLT